MPSKLKFHNPAGFFLFPFRNKPVFPRNAKPLRGSGYFASVMLGILDFDQERDYVFLYF